MEPLYALRLADLQVFAAVAHHRSIAAAAQRFDRSASAIRTALARLERELGAALFVGGDDALELTAAAARIRPIVEEVLDRALRLELDDGDVALRGDRLTLSAPTFVAERLLPLLARSPALQKIRGFSLPPQLIGRFVEDQQIDVAVTVGSELEPAPGWSSAQVALVRYGLFAAPATARSLGPRPTVDDVRARRFVAPVYVMRTGELVPGDDGCPLPRSERIVGHEVESMTLACRVAAETDHLVYGPALAAEPFVVSGQLEEVPVEGWSKTDPLFVACDGSAVRGRLRDAIHGCVRSMLGAARTSGVVAIDGTSNARDGVRSTA